MITRTSWRWTELSLLILPFSFMFVGLALLSLTGIGLVGEQNLRAAIGITGLLLVGHVALTWRCRQSDQLLFPMTAMLVSIGLIMVSRLAPDLAIRQAVWVALGLIVFVGIVSFLPDVALLQSYKYTSAILGLLLVATTFVFGTDPNASGARLWLSAGGMYFQPSEILKVLLVVFLAGYLEDKRELLSWSSSALGRLRLPPLPYLGPLLVMWAVSMLMLVAQRDLGAALLLFGVFLTMLYVASSRGVYVWGGLIAFLAGGFIATMAFSHVQVRIDIWLDPWSRAYEEGYQIVQGLVALASGGILGSGLGFGHPDYVPAVWTDYVIAAIGEEMGLAGSLAVVALYMLLVYRGFRIALEAKRGFSILLAAGLTAVLGIQALVILAGTIKLMPLTGITLPFISYGGSSVVTNFLIIGLLLRVSADER
jgi:cell division protein FtsW (lipid II flippase)